MKKRITCLILSVLLLLCGCSFNDSSRFDDFADSLFKQELSSNLLNLHFSLSDSASFGIDDYAVSFGDFSREARASSTHDIKETLQQLHKIKRFSLSDKQKLDYDVLEDYLDKQLALSDYELYSEVLSPSNGLQGQLPILLSEYNFRTKSDIEEYISLLSTIDLYFKQIIDFEFDKSSEGLFMDDGLCIKVIKECENFIAKTDDNLLITSFEKRVNDCDFLSDKERDSYISQNRTCFEEHVIKAYKVLITGLTNLLGTGKNNKGLFYYPDGKKYYELLVASDTGCSHKLDDLFKEIDAQRSSDLTICSQNFTSCEDIKLDFQQDSQMLDALQTAMKADFPSSCDTSYRLCQVDSSLQDSLAPAFYITAPFDDYKNNSIYINPGCSYDDITLFTTLAHEGFPGHLYQTVMSYSSGLSPLRSLLDVGGFTEGWATYAEMQSYYYAGLDAKTAAFLQSNQAFSLSLYASSDIGIHYYGWDYKKMAEFWEDYGITDDDTIQEIMDYIIADPGNYLKYYVGYLEFLELKNTAQKKYGDSFNAVNFHKAILDIGPAPFDILSEYLDDYYAN